MREYDRMDSAGISAASANEHSLRLKPYQPVPCQLRRLQLQFLHDQSGQDTESMDAFNDSASLNASSPIIPTLSNGLKNTGQSKALRILCNKKQ